MQRRKCPACSQVVTCSKLEMLDEKAIKVQSAAGRLEEAVEAGDVARAKSLIKEILILNRELQIEQINSLVKQMKKKIAAL